MRLRGFNADITLYTPTTQHPTTVTSGIRRDNQLDSVLNKISPKPYISLTLRQPAIFKTDNDFQGIVLKGIDEAANHEFINQYIISGEMPSALSDTNQILISQNTANALNLAVGDKIDTHFFIGDGIKTRRFDISGIYDTHFHDFDQTVAFVPISMLQKLNGFDNQTGSAIEITGLPLDSIDNAATSLYGNLIGLSIRDPENPRFFEITTINETCAVYFNWLNLLNTNVIVIIILMSFVSAFTLISSLFIIILQRVKTIGILKSIGSDDKLIRQTFILMAMRIVLYGLLIGNSLALTCIYIQRGCHFIHLDPETYYLSYVPMNISIATILIINACAIILSSLILIVPSQIVSRITPTKSLRYE